MSTARDKPGVHELKTNDYQAPTMTQIDDTPTVECRFSNADAARKWTDMYSSETELLDEFCFRRRRDVTLERITKALADGGSVLDVGCGAAPVLSELRKKGIRCVGLEYSADMISHAKDRLRSLGLSTQGILRGDCRSMPFEDRAFDIVVCLGVISYVEDYEDVLRELRRLVKPGGKVIISFRNKFNPVLSDPVRLVKRAARRLLGIQRKETFAIGRFLDHREVHSKASKFGFNLEEHIGIGFGPFRFNGRRLFSERASIRINNGITRLFNLMRWRAPFLWLTDVSIWVYAAPSSTQHANNST